MEKKTLDMIERKDMKKRAARRLRAEGKIPAVIYGKEGAKSIAIDGSEFAREFDQVSENIIITLGKGKKAHDVLIKDYQYDYLKNRMVHIDFYEMEKGKTLTTNIPVKFVGSPEGVKEGGVLEEYFNELEVECLPKDIPEFIEVDIDALNIGDSLHLADITAPKGVTFQDSDEQTLVAIHHPTSVGETETGEEAEFEEAEIVGAEAEAGEEAGEE